MGSHLDKWQNTSFHMWNYWSDRQDEIVRVILTRQTMAYCYTHTKTTLPQVLQMLSSPKQLRDILRFSIGIEDKPIIKW